MHTVRTYRCRPRATSDNECHCTFSRSCHLAAAALTLGCFELPHLGSSASKKIAAQHLRSAAIRQRLGVNFVACGQQENVVVHARIDERADFGTAIWPSISTESGPGTSLSSPFSSLMPAQFAGFRRPGVLPGQPRQPQYLITHFCPSLLVGRFPAQITRCPHFAGCPTASADQRLRNCRTR